MCFFLISIGMNFRNIDLTRYSEWYFLRFQYYSKKSEYILKLGFSI